MTQTIAPCLWFDGNAEEAVHYYVSVFGDSKVLHVDRFSDVGPDPEAPVVFIEFRLNGQPFQAVNGGPQFPFTEAVSFAIECADQGEVDHYWNHPLEPKIDLIITEMRNTTYRQPAWYRYVAGFAGDKPVVVVENPYGGVVPELIDKLKAGQGYDQFRMSLYEAAAMGANMSAPYGSWMGSVIQDSFYAPHDLVVEIQSFLAEHEHLYNSRTFSEVGVVYSVGSNQQMVARRDVFADNRLNVSEGEAVPFWQVCEELSDSHQSYDVIFFPDGELREDSLRAADLARYGTLILPDCRFITPFQAVVLFTYLEDGGNLLITGELGVNLPDDLRQHMLGHTRTTRVDLTEGFSTAQLPGGQQVQATTQANLAINVQQVEGGAAVHIIRYDYDEASDEVPVLPELDLDLRLRQTFTSARAHAPTGTPEVTLNLQDGRHHLELRNVPLYTIVLLTLNEEASQ